MSLSNCCKDNQRVVLLIFRLNGSNKVRIIYTTHLEIMGKTLQSNAKALVCKDLHRTIFQNT